MRKTPEEIREDWFMQLLGITREQAKAMPEWRKRALERQAISGRVAVKDTTGKVAL